MTMIKNKVEELEVKVKACVVECKMEYMIVMTNMVETQERPSGMNTLMTNMEELKRPNC